MRFIPFISIAILAFNIYGCSADTAKRLAYETVQNLKQQECQKNKVTDCNNRQSYDQYRQELQTTEDEKLNTQ